MHSIFNVYPNIVDCLVPDIETVFDFHSGNNALTKLLADKCSGIKLITKPDELKKHRKVYNENHTAVVYNACRESGICGTDDTAKALIDRLCSFNCKQIILTGFAINRVKYEQPIDFTSDSLISFYERVMLSDELLNNYMKSVFADTFDTEDVVVADIVHFALRYFSDLPIEIAVDNHYLHCPIEDIYNIVYNLTDYYVDTFNYSVDDGICQSLYKDLGIWVDYPIRYEISLLKTNL